MVGTAQGAAQTTPARGLMARRRLVRAAQARVPNHVRACDLVLDRNHRSHVLRMLAMADELTRECLAIRVERRLGSREVLEVLAELSVSQAELSVSQDAPEHVRSDNYGPEFVASKARELVERLGAGVLLLCPGAGGRAATAGSFNGRVPRRVARA